MTHVNELEMAIAPLSSLTDSEISYGF